MNKENKKKKQRFNQQEMAREKCPSFFSLFFFRDDNEAFRADHARTHTHGHAHGHHHCYSAAHGWSGAWFVRHH